MNESMNRDCFEVEDLSKCQLKENSGGKFGISMLSECIKANYTSVYLCVCYTVGSFIRTGTNRKIKSLTKEHYPLSCNTTIQSCLASQNAVSLYYVL